MRVMAITGRGAAEGRGTGKAAAACLPEDSSELRIDIVLGEGEGGQGRSAPRRGALET